MTFTESINYPNAASYSKKPVKIELWTGVSNAKTEDLEAIEDSIVVMRGHPFSHILSHKYTKPYSTVIISGLNRSVASANLVDRVQITVQGLCSSTRPLNFGLNQVSRIILDFETEQVPWHHSYRLSRRWMKEPNLLRYQTYTHRHYETTDKYTKFIEADAAKRLREDIDPRIQATAEAAVKRRKTLNNLKRECQARDAKREE